MGSEKKRPPSLGELILKSTLQDEPDEGHRLLNCRLARERKPTKSAERARGI